MRTKKIIAFLGSMVMLAGVSACGTNDPTASTTSDGKTIIKIQTFNNYGYGKSTAERPGANLWAEYEKQNPNVKIEETVASSSDEARTAFNTAISSGSNAYDIYGVDISWMPSIRAMADKFTDLSSYTKNNSWPDWVRQGGESTDGKLIGAGTDIGPTALCYRSDLFEKAGLPTDREQVKELFGGDDATWDKFFEIGQSYTEKTGKPFIDSLSDISYVMKAQMEEVYVSKDDKVIAADTDMKNMYDMLAKNVNISAGLSTWSDDWNAAFKAGDGFAVLTCPAWELNNVKGNSGEDFTGWDVADVTPGGAGANQGESWLVVPESSPVKGEAAKLVAWLTAPEQQAKVFAAASNFPSSADAQKLDKVSGKLDEYFNNAPVGEIFANRAAAIKHVPYMNGQYYDIDTKFADALNRLDVTKEQSASQSWKQYEDDVKALS